MTSWAVEVTVVKCQHFSFIECLGLISIFQSVPLCNVFAYGNCYDARLSNLSSLFNYYYMKIDFVLTTRGATSVVFRCEEKQTEKPYAVKVLKKTVSWVVIIKIFSFFSKSQNDCLRLCSLCHQFRLTRKLWGQRSESCCVSLIQIL